MLDVLRIRQTYLAILLLPPAVLAALAAGWIRSASRANTLATGRR